MCPAIRVIVQPAFNPVEISTRSEAVNILRVPATTRTLPAAHRQDQSDPPLLRRYDLTGSQLGQRFPSSTAAVGASANAEQPV